MLQSRKNPMFGGPFAGVRSGTDAGDAHLAHMALNRLAVDRHLRLQQHGELARAVEGTGRVQLVDAPLEVEFFRAGRHRLVVQAGTVEAEQVALGLQT